MITQNHANSLSDEIEKLMSELSEDVSNVRKESKIKVTCHDNQEAISDPFSMEHTPQHASEATIFVELLIDELFREVETDNSKKFYQGIIPSRKLICKIQKRLHSVGDVMNPFEIEETPSGEAI